MNIRPFKSSDTENLIDLWNRALPIDKINLSVLERKVLLDPNFDEQGLLVYETNDTLVGFILSIVRKMPMEGVGLQEDKGWITAMGVDPAYRRSGIGSKLLNEAIKFFHSKNRKEILVSPYVPNYFVPGIDVKSYSVGMRFFKKFGFDEISHPLSMDANIVGLKIPQEILETEKKLRNEGIYISFYERDDLLPYLKFQSKFMPGDWLELARRNLMELTKGNFEADQIVLAKKNDKIIGFCQYEHEHFGPIGVIDEYQSKGVGTVLLANALQQMIKKGIHNAWVLWTSDKAAKIYKKFGFKETRRFAIMRKKL